MELKTQRTMLQIDNTTYQVGILMQNLGQVGDSINQRKMENMLQAQAPSTSTTNSIFDTDLDMEDLDDIPLAVPIEQTNANTCTQNNVTNSNQI